MSEKVESKPKAVFDDSGDESSEDDLNMLHVNKTYKEEWVDRSRKSWIGLKNENNAKS